MKRLSILFILCISLLMQSIVCFAFDNNNQIVILYENDVHCAVDGYAKIAALKKEELQNTNYVATVSCGDFIQGGNIGAVSKGKYIIDIMNQVGYDVVTLGNHEFDYTISRLRELTDELNAKTVCCNFKDIAKDKSVFEPYTIISYGDTDIAYIGVTTPDTVTMSSPSQFYDENYNYIYSFQPENLYETVQNTIDAAKENGADYIIALTHLGTENVYEKWSAQTLIKNTRGLDVVLDGHSHSVVEKMKVADKEGNDVLLSSTGTAFANIGKLTISDELIDTTLIFTEEYNKTDNIICDYIENINNEYKSLGERKIGTSNVKLTTLNDDGSRAVRNSETNIGDLCADAFRSVLNTDIGFINGGGIRADINIGDITFNELLSVFPWNNKVCAAEITGAKILDLLEFSVSDFPNEKGGFQQVSGIKFDIDTSIPSPVQIDENTAFVGIQGERRVKNVMVENKETNVYEHIDPAKIYTVASHQYLLTDCGDGYSMLKDINIIKNTGMIDIELLENYIKDDLNCNVGEKYSTPQKRINIIPKQEYIPLRKTFEDLNCEVIWTSNEPFNIKVKTNLGDLNFTVNTNNVEMGDNTYQANKVTYIENGITYISPDCVDFYKSIVE